MSVAMATLIGRAQMVHGVHARKSIAHSQLLTALFSVDVARSIAPLASSGST
jgi:hypothetical protein